MLSRLRRLVALASRHRALAAVALLVAGVLTAAAVAWFEPHKLFVDDRVDEALPSGALIDPAPAASPSPSGAAASPQVGGVPAADPAAASNATTQRPTAGTAPPAEAEAPAAAAPAPPAEPQVRTVARAPFRSLEHSTGGDAVVLELPDGSRVLRLENFSTSNGPDLRVYLSAGSDDAFFGRQYGEEFVELGELKGNVGSQNYTIPPGTDLSRFRNAVIWCKRFSVGFGVATFS